MSPKPLQHRKHEVPGPQCSRELPDDAANATPLICAAVMNACRSVCGPTVLVIPARRVTRRTIRPAALAGDDQGPVPALDPHCLDIGTGGLRHAKPVQGEQRDKRALGGRAEPGRDQQGAISLRSRAATLVSRPAMPARIALTTVPISSVLGTGCGPPETSTSMTPAHARISKAETRGYLAPARIPIELRAVSTDKREDQRR